MAAGMARSWTLVLVIGWYSVGTQMKRKSIKDALAQATKNLNIPRSLAYPEAHTEENSDEIRSVESWGLEHPHEPLGQRERTLQGDNGRQFGYSILGDEESPGPLFNYARSVTWAMTAVLAIDAHREPRLSGNDEPLTNRDRLIAKCGFNPCGDEESLGPMFGTPGNSRRASSRGTGDRDSNVGLETQPGAAQQRILPPKFSSTELPNTFFRTFISVVMFHFAIMLPVFLFAYYTPVVGFGCHSVSFLIYFLASLVSATLLVFSARLSKQWYRRWQTSNARISNHPLGIAAVGTRLLGKSLAFGNSLWILPYNIFDFHWVL